MSKSSENSRCGSNSTLWSFVIFDCGKDFGSNEYLGVGYLSSVLEDAGFTTIQHHAPLSGRLPTDEVASLNPGVLALPVLGHNARRVADFANVIRAALPNVHITVGNRVASVAARELLESCPSINSAVRGEGERTVVEIASRLASGLSLHGCLGVTFRDGTQIVENDERPLISNLDSIPFPHRPLPEAHNLRYFRISSVRGCLGRCSFCDGADGPQQSGQRVRTRSVESVLTEIQTLLQHYGINRFEFVDSSFEDPPDPRHQRIWDFVEGIERRRLSIRYILQFRCESFDRQDFELLQRLKNSGMEAVFLGIEAGNEDDLRLFRKRATLEDHIKSVRLFRDVGVHVLFGFINFTPYSTFGRLRSNIDFLQSQGLAYNAEALFSRLELYIGCPIMKRLHQDGLTSCHPPYVDPYDYAFVDPRINKLCAKLQDINISPITDFQNREKAMVTFVRDVERVAGQYEEIGGKLQAFRNAHQSFRDDMNDLSAATFRECADLMEAECDPNDMTPLLERHVREFAEGWSSMVHQQYRLGMDVQRMGISPQSLRRIKQDTGLHS